MKRNIQIDVVRDDSNLVGECPIWHAEERALYWIDARKPSIQKLDPEGRLTTWRLPKRIGSFCFRQSGGIVAGMEDGFFEVDLSEATANGDTPIARTLILDPEPDRPDNRLNDGRCDRKGRFWCGSRTGENELPQGSVYRLTPDRRCTTVDRNFITPNGMAFSPDDKTMLLADTRADVIYKYDFDLDDGVISNRTEFFSTRDMPGRIDGAAFDSDGGYWCALVYDWSVARFDPKGRLDRLIRLPVRHPTMCAFGGDNLDVLYITSGKALLSEGEGAAQPLAGALFAVHGLGVSGIAEPRFAG